MVGRSISHYTIVEKLGGGGMGVVYRARDDRLSRDVALKFLPPELTLDAQAKQRFIHEARAASALDHPNICTIHEIDEADDGQLFIVMSCYEGRSLRQRIQDGPLPFDQVIDVVMQLGDGLRAAHGRGIIHRDLKPENVIITDAGVVKILDFGLAKLEGQSMLTVEGSTLGTAAYMAPEQIRGESADRRSDIFSYAVIFYELLASRHPFRGDHQLALMYSIANENPPALREVVPAIPEELERLVAKGLRKDLNDRYQSMDELLSDLLAATSQRKVTPAEGPGSEQEVTPGAGRGGGLFSKKTWAVLGASLLVLMGVSILVFTGVFETDGSARRELARMHLEKARADYGRGDKDLAERELSLAVEVDPSYALAWSDLSVLSIQSGRVDEAVLQARRAVALDERSASARYNLGYALDEKGDHEGAHEAYSMALGLDSAFAGAYSALGNLLIRMDRAQQAMRILELGLSRTHDEEVTFRLLKNLGMAQHTLGQYDAAASSFRESLKAEPAPVAETRRLLALTLEALGKKGESLALWKEYLTLEKDEALKKLAQEHIVKLER